MRGTEEFAANNFRVRDPIFDSCIHLIVYGYSLLEKNTTYSRQHISNVTSKVRGKQTKKIELEDYLRNDLVTRYIEPNRKLFGLDYYLFQSGVEEFLENIKTGILDIKVCSPLYNGTLYYIFECKRLNKSILDNYVKEGVLRFTEVQYYPEIESTVAGMISFLESVSTETKIKCGSSFKEIDSILKKYTKETMLRSNLSKVKLVCTNFDKVENFKYVFMSVHNRVKKTEPIKLYHIVLDYNDLIT